MRLMAFESAKTHSAVMIGRIDGPSTMKPAKGSLSWYIVAPREVQDRRGEELARDLRRGAHLAEVVQHAHDEDHAGREQHARASRATRR